MNNYYQQNTKNMQKKDYSEGFTKKTVKLGDLLTELMEKRILPQQQQLLSLNEHWQQLLPTGFCNHCRIAGISNGNLKVFVDSTSYIYQLKLYSSKLLTELQHRCPQVRIRGIELAIQ